MRVLFSLTLILGFSFSVNTQGYTFEEASEVNFSDLFPTLFRLKRSLIETSNEEGDDDTRFKPGPSKQFEQYLFQQMLQAHNLNLGDLRDIVVDAKGNYAEIVLRLNEAFGKELLYIDEDDFLRINSEDYFLFFNGYISQVTRENPFLDTIVNNVLKPYVSNIQVKIAEFRVPMETILERVRPHLRNRREVSNRMEDVYLEDSRLNKAEDGNNNFVQNFFNSVVEWLRNISRDIVKTVIHTLNGFTGSLFLPAFEMLQAFLLGIIESIVDTILRANEFTHEFPTDGSVKSYDSNQLASNSPMEDTRSEAKCLLTSGLLFAVYDGHGGAACAQVLAKRLFAYISAYLLPPPALNQYIASLSSSSPLHLLEAYNDRVQFVDDVRDIYRASFRRYLDDIALLDYGKAFEMRKALEESVLRLDSDLADEALARVEDGTLNLKTLSVAMTGAVACVAHIDGAQLHIAHVGDCNAVLGVRTESNTWIANKLTTEHNTYNSAEYNRIISEHPHNESNTVLKMGRLLGQLAPLRALGDFRYKWSISVMRDIVQQQFGDGAMPPNYYTPPYLTSRPEVIHHRLTPRDKFLVLATDGLWDIVSPLQVVRLVGEHMSGKVTLSPLKLPRRNMKLADIHESLVTRREGLLTKPRDRNASTHLIRSALGGTEYGIDHGKLSQMLSLPEDVVRVFRDDITVTVVYFDSEYLRHCPA